MRQLNNTFLLRSALTCGAALLVAGIIIGSSQADASSTGKHLVTIYDKSTKKVIVTNANTVGEALKQADVSVQPTDSVDPKPLTALKAKAYQVNIYRAQPVLVIDGNSRHFVLTSSETPSEIAKSAHIPYYDEDRATLDRSDNVLDSEGAGLQLTIDRATKFTLELYGKPITARTQATTVGAMLKGKNITLAKTDTTSIPLSTPIKANMKVKIWRNGKQTINQEKPIVFPVRQIQDADQPVGYKKIQTPGVLGKKNITYEVNLQNGKEKSRKVIQEVVLQKPRQQVEIIGIKSNISGGLDGALARLRACESGGNYANKNNPTYRGAYQFGYGTWGGYGGYNDPANAPPAVQDQAAKSLYERSGWGPWGCASIVGLQDIYR